jgi:hypothetical protein
MSILSQVQQHRQRPSQLRLESPQESDDILAMNIVRQQIEVQIQTPGSRTDRDATDRRQAIASVPAMQHWFEALELIAAAELCSTDRPFLYEDADFQECLAQLEIERQN